VCHVDCTFADRVLSSLRYAWERYGDGPFPSIDVIGCESQIGPVNDLSKVPDSFLERLYANTNRILLAGNESVRHVSGMELPGSFTYDLIITFPLSPGTISTMQLLSSLDITFSRSIVLSSDDDLDKYFILRKHLSKQIADAISILSESDQIIAPTAFVEYLPPEVRAKLVFQTFPIDFEYMDTWLKEDSALVLENKNPRLSLQLFTKQSTRKDLNKLLARILMQQRNISYLGYFSLPGISKRHFVSDLWEVMKTRRFLRTCNTGLVSFSGIRPLSSYLAHLNSFDALVVQRRGGLSAIKFAVLKGKTLVAANDSINKKILSDDYGLDVLGIEDIPKLASLSGYRKEVADKNRSILKKVIENSMVFWARTMRSDRD
jgi:hypothetical protein